MKISALVKDPGRVPRHVWISNSLEALQKAVEGYIETVTLATDLVVICNEEGRLMNLEPNCNIWGYDKEGMECQKSCLSRLVASAVRLFAGLLIARELKAK